MPFVESKDAVSSKMSFAIPEPVFQTYPLSMPVAVTICALTTESALCAANFLISENVYYKSRIVKRVVKKSAGEEYNYAFRNFISLLNRFVKNVSTTRLCNQINNIPTRLFVMPDCEQLLNTSHI